jgi:EF hand
MPRMVFGAALVSQTRNEIMMSGINRAGGMPSADMMAQMRNKMFSKADSDGSGGVDIKEFSAMTKMGPPGAAGGLSEADTKAEFKKLDGNGDGAIDKAELEKGVKEMMSKFQSTMAKFAKPEGADAAPGVGGVGGESSSNDKSLQTLLKALEGAANKHKTQGSAGGSKDGAHNLQQMLQRLSSQLGNTYGAAGNSPQLMAQA